MAKRPSDHWLRASRLKIDPQEINDLIAEFNAIREAEGPIDDSFTVIAMILICRQSKKADRAFAISERIYCLHAMMADERMRGWTRKDRDPDCNWVESSVFAAVAKCPLRMENDRFRFDPDEFFAIALRERDGEVEGPQ